MQTVEKILLSFDPEEKNLLPALKEIGAVFGFVSKGDGKKIADYFSVSENKVHQTASFYDMIRTEKQPTLVIKVCSGTHCAVSRSFEIIGEIENFFHIKAGDEFHAYLPTGQAGRQAGNPKVKLEIISCLGRCGEGPIVVINDKIYERVTASSVHKILQEWI